MNNAASDNTNRLITAGLMLVFLPTMLTVFGPLAMAAVWIFGAGKSLLWPLFAAMLAGLLLSFFYFRFSSVRWLRWALRRSNNLPALKRKAIKYKLVAEAGQAVFTNSSFLDLATQQAFEQIDSARAARDAPDVPPVLLLYRSSANRGIAVMAAAFFLVAAMLILLLLPWANAWMITPFAPLLLVSLVFAGKKDRETLALRMDETGIECPAGSWKWEDIEDIRFINKTSSYSGAGRTSYFSNIRKELSFKTFSGDRVIIPLSAVRSDFDFEEHMAVYRLRHANAMGSVVKTN